jgi:hypothetical protein
MGGFYKRGSQVKTLYPSQGGFVSWHPAPAGNSGAASIVLFASTTAFPDQPEVRSVLI